MGYIEEPMPPYTPYAPQMLDMPFMEGPFEEEAGPHPTGLVPDLSDWLTMPETCLIRKQPNLPISASNTHLLASTRLVATVIVLYGYWFLDPKLSPQTLQLLSCSSISDEKWAALSPLSCVIRGSGCATLFIKELHSQSVRRATMIAAR